MIGEVAGAQCAGAGADPPPPLHSKSVETFLFTSDRLLGWAGLDWAGWAEQDTGGQVRWSAARLVCVLWLCAGLGG